VPPQADREEIAAEGFAGGDVGDIDADFWCPPCGVDPEMGGDPAVPHPAEHCAEDSGSDGSLGDSAFWDDIFRETGYLAADGEPASDDLPKADNPMDMCGAFSGHPRGGSAESSGSALGGGSASSSSAAAASSSSGAAPERLGRSKADTVVLFINGGKIVYYRQQRFIEIHCGNPKHGKCVLTRKMYGNPLFPAQGRPLGLAAYWLSLSPLGDKDAHWECFRCGREAFPSWADRRAGRDSIESFDCDAAQVLLAEERPKRPEEPDKEPPGCP
jgi:hypothetical protein